MRHLLFALIGIILAGCASTPTEPLQSVAIEGVKPRYIPEQNFKRISEYWRGDENKGDRIIIRSEPEARAGFYFILFLDERVRKLPKGSVIIGECFTPFSKEVQTHNFPLPNNMPKTKEVFVGLTGTDWPDPDGVPSAWRFTIKDANGKTLAQKQSYLWSM